MYLAGVRSRTDHEVIGDNRQVVNVQQRNVTGLLIGSGVNKNLC